MAQVLHIANGDTVNKKLEAKEGRVSTFLADQTPNERIVQEAYLTALSRFPTPVEKEKFVAALTAAPESERRAVIEDVYWALLSSKEFLFNH